jgi:putative membrane protein
MLSMAAKDKEERLLVLCVDRDGDIGAKTEEKTPILGRENNLRAAVSLALNDPEEPDANAMFEALRLHDQLKKQGQSQEKTEVATISGLQILGVEADRKLVRELTTVLEAFPASNVILVTDGYADEVVLPLVESRAPVTSVRRIVIKHSESIEETAALFGKYFKMLVNTPRYSRIVLGVPGLMLIILAIMYLGGWIYAAWIALLIVFGTLFLVKGFGVDRATIGLVRWIREYEPPSLPIQIAGSALAGGVIALSVGVFLGINGAAVRYSQNPPTSPEGLAGLLPVLVGEFIGQSIYLIVIGICVTLSGRIVRWYFERDIRLLRTVVFIVVIAWSSQIFSQVSAILVSTPTTGTGVALVFTIFIGILLAIATTLVVFVLNIKYGSFFRKKQKKVEEFGQG